MIGRCLRQHQPEKLAQRQRIRGAPRNGALGIQAFEIPDQQQPEVPARRQAGSADLVGIKRLAESFDVPVEVMLVEDLIQSRVERMRGSLRQASPPTSTPASRAAVVCPSPSATV
jgi:hypothetical protein